MSSDEECVWIGAGLASMVWLAIVAFIIMVATAVVDSREREAVASGAAYWKVDDKSGAVNNHAKLGEALREADTWFANHDYEFEETPVWKKIDAVLASLERKEG